MSDLILWGASGHGKVVLDVARAVGDSIQFRSSTMPSTKRMASSAIARFSAPAITCGF